MTRTARRHPTASAPAQVLTVADLVRRHGPVAPAVVPDAPRRRSTRLPVRLAVGAGVLLAAGSVLAAAATTSAPVAGPPGGGAAAPDRGPLGPARPAVPLLGAAAATGALDPGVAPAGSWTRTAFPDAVADDPAPADDVPAPEADERTAPDDAPVADGDDGTSGADGPDGLDGPDGSGTDDVGDDRHPGRSEGRGGGHRSDDGRHDRGHGPRGDDTRTRDVLDEVADLL